MVSGCPICEAGFAAHSYAIFAITIATEGRRARIVEFLRLVEQRRWRELAVIQEFNATLDALEATAIRCVDARIAMVVWQSPKELWASHVLVGCDLRTPEDGEEITRLLAPDKWRPLDA